MGFALETVLFDLSGTLIDDFLVVWKSFCQVFEHYGQPPPSLGKFRREFKLPHESYLIENGIESGNVKEAVELGKKTYLESAFQLGLFPDVRIVLKCLKAKGITIGIVSQTPRKLLDASLEKSGLAEFFDDKNTLSSDDTEEQKPRPEPIIAAMRRINVSDGKRTVYVGDMVEDIVMAKTAGVIPVAIHREGANYNSLEMLKKSNPHRIIQDLTELITIFHL